MADPQKPNASDRLVDLLGFDPAKKPTIGDKTSKLFQDTLKELTEEREKKAKEEAKTLMQKAMQLQEERAKARKQFQGADQKFEKELGKILNQINSMLTGKEPEPDQEEKEPQPA